MYFTKCQTLYNFYDHYVDEKPNLCSIISTIKYYFGKVNNVLWWHFDFIDIYTLNMTHYCCQQTFIRRLKAVIHLIGYCRCIERPVSHHESDGSLSLFTSDSRIVPLIPTVSGIATDECTINKAYQKHWLSESDIPAAYLYVRRPLVYWYTIHPAFWQNLKTISVRRSTMPGH